MGMTRLKVYQLVFLTLIGNFAYAYDRMDNDEDFNNLANLGQRISDMVNRQLAPLQNLNQRIQTDVQRQILNNDNRRFFEVPMPDLTGLNNLGQQIQQSVYESLEPVRALELVMKMKNGVGGVTIATHLPEGRNFIIMDYKVYTCNGVINQDGRCDGRQIPFQINSKRDYCYYRESSSIVNNQICIGANTVSIVNNNVQCLSNTGNPVLLMSLEEFNRMCQGVSEKVRFTYIANPQHPQHIQIPNQNKHVKCENNQTGVCIFTETNKPSVFNSYGNVVFNSHIGG
ncbi:hypothetical protein NQ315_009955 [Exocentrus adspersus]|uniref:Uncharacterized protein n=1 Tax=Exocentrus adspersus TaxID=1586481 RepID=A0AAV8WI16_9CUCU|nr:hypothetical protein NQ315_009955 [Exocentrus adspersus]